MDEIISIFNKRNPLSKEAKLSLLSLLHKRGYIKSEIILPTGSQCRTIYFVTHGITRIFYHKDGDDVTEHFAFPGDMIIRAESLFTGQPTQKGIQAISDCELISMPAQPLFDLFIVHHDLERLFNKIFIDAYVATVKRVESLQFKTATERYLELAQHTTWLNQIPLKYIASYLGITQVSLSRIRSQIRLG
ncbi:MAG TPA: Crp/Fnr family transcriptional regulator [Saprospiraceae bacterium]|nr:Crp/Fnr family transcriptional regulator [Saprospiraceae bacterium]